MNVAIVEIKTCSRCLWVHDGECEKKNIEMADKLKAAGWSDADLEELYNSTYGDPIAIRARGVLNEEPSLAMCHNISGNCFDNPADGEGYCDCNQER